MYQNENLHSSSITLMTSKDHRLTLITVKANSKNHSTMTNRDCPKCGSRDADCRSPDAGCESRGAGREMLIFSHNLYQAL